MPVQKICHVIPIVGTEVIRELRIARPSGRSAAKELGGHLLVECSRAA